MENKKTGGPAFAAVSGTTQNGYLQKGITKLDYFAAKAIQGSLNGCMCKDCGTIEQRVMEAYQIADAMLKESKKYE